MAKLRGNPAVVTKIKPGLDMQEFMRTHQGIEDVADYSRIYGKPKKKSKKSKKAKEEVAHLFLEADQVQVILKLGVVKQDGKKHKL